MKVIKGIMQFTCFALLAVQLYSIFENFLGPRAFVAVSVVITIIACGLYALEIDEVRRNAYGRGYSNTKKRRRKNH